MASTNYRFLTPDTSDYYANLHTSTPPYHTGHFHYSLGAISHGDHENGDADDDDDDCDGGDNDGDCDDDEDDDDGVSGSMYGGPKSSIYLARGPPSSDYNKRAIIDFTSHHSSSSFNSHPVCSNLSSLNFPLSSSSSSSSQSSQSSLSTISTKLSQLNTTHGKSDASNVVSMHAGTDPHHLYGSPNNNNNSAPNIHFPCGGNSKGNLYQQHPIGDIAGEDTVIDTLTPNVTIRPAPHSGTERQPALRHRTTWHGLKKLMKTLQLNLLNSCKKRYTLFLTSIITIIGIIIITLALTLALVGSGVITFSHPLNALETNHQTLDHFYYLRRYIPINNGAGDAMPTILSGDRVTDDDDVDGRNGVSDDNIVNGDNKKKDNMDNSRHHVLGDQSMNRSPSAGAGTGPTLHSDATQVDAPAERIPPSAPPRTPPDLHSSVNDGDGDDDESRHYDRGKVGSTAQFNSPDPHTAPATAGHHYNNLDYWAPAMYDIILSELSVPLNDYLWEFTLNITDQVTLNVIQHVAKMAKAPVSRATSGGNTTTQNNNNKQNQKNIIDAADTSRPIWMLGKLSLNDIIIENIHNRLNVIFAIHPRADRWDYVSDTSVPDTTMDARARSETPGIANKSPPQQPGPQLPSFSTNGNGNGKIKQYIYYTRVIETFQHELILTIQTLFTQGKIKYKCCCHNLSPRTPVNVVDADDKNLGGTKHRHDPTTTTARDNTICSVAHIGLAPPTPISFFADAPHGTTPDRPLVCHILQRTPHDTPHFSGESRFTNHNINHGNTPGRSSPGINAGRSSRGSPPPDLFLEIGIHSHAGNKFNDQTRCLLQAILDETIEEVFI